jgi:hypothetical protein
VLFGFGINSLTLLIMNFLMIQRGLQKEDLASRLVFFGADGVNTFQGFKYGVIVQIQQQYVPFVIGVHCMVH